MDNFNNDNKFKCINNVLKLFKTAITPAFAEYFGGVSHGLNIWYTSQRFCHIVTHVIHCELQFYLLYKKVEFHDFLLVWLISRIVRMVSAVKNCLINGNRKNRFDNLKTTSNRRRLIDDFGFVTDLMLIWWT